MRPRVSVFIPTLDAGPRLDDLLLALERQRGVDLEILVTDSGSEDGDTLRILATHGIEPARIDRADFDHGDTRNAAARRARGELIAFLSQDALPLDDDYLVRLAAPFVDPTVAGAFAAQEPRPDVHPFQRLNLDRHMAGSASWELRPAIEPAAWAAMAPAERVERIRFDDVASMIRTSDLIARPFPRRAFAEDLAWARSSLLAGRALAFCPGARVQHSHGLDRGEFSTRTALVHAALRELCDFVPIDGPALLVRRIVGTSLRFWRAAITAPGRSIWRRVGDVLVAPYWATVQMRAMRRGAAGARYLPPR
ncbi:MAG: glycosyltransferase [Planctomycetes bacterium]|nr:glycosyltransferase [Planctomycetota bacterium]